MEKQKFELRKFEKNFLAEIKSIFCNIWAVIWRKKMKNSGHKSLKVVFGTFLLICFVCLKESAFGRRKFFLFLR